MTVPDETLSHLHRAFETEDGLLEWALDTVQTVRMRYSFLRFVMGDEFAAKVLAEIIYIDAINLPRRAGRRAADHRLNIRILAAWDTATAGQRETAVADAAGARTVKARRAAMEKARRLVKRRDALIENPQFRRVYDQALVMFTKEQAHKSSE